MVAVDCSGSIGQRRGVEALNAERFQPQDGAGHIHNRIQRADLMKMNFFDRFAVHASFGLGQQRENTPRRLLDALGKLALGQDFQNVGQVPVVMAVRNDHFQ